MGFPIPSCPATQTTTPYWPAVLISEKDNNKLPASHMLFLEQFFPVLCLLHRQLKPMFCLPPMDESKCSKTEKWQAAVIAMSWNNFPIS